MAGDVHHVVDAAEQPQVAVRIALGAIADRILVPVTPDLPALRAAVQLRQVALELDVADRLVLLVNRANSGVSVADIEQTVGMSSTAQIRSAGLHLVWAANAGRTVIERFPRHKVTEDFALLADRLLALHGIRPVAPPARDARTMLRSLLGRRLPAQA